MSRYRKSSSLLTATLLLLTKRCCLRKQQTINLLKSHECASFQLVAPVDSKWVKRQRAAVVPVSHWDVKTTVWSANSSSQSSLRRLCSERRTPGELIYRSLKVSLGWIPGLVIINARSRTTPPSQRTQSCDGHAVTIVCVCVCVGQRWPFENGYVAVWRILLKDFVSTPI